MSLRRAQSKEDQQKERDTQAEEQEKEAQQEEVSCWKNLQSSPFSSCYYGDVVFTVTISLASEAAGSL